MFLQMKMARELLAMLGYMQGMASCFTLPKTGRQIELLSFLALHMRENGQVQGGISPSRKGRCDGS